MSAEIFDKTWKTWTTPEVTGGPRSCLFSPPDKSMMDRYLDELMLHNDTPYCRTEQTRNYSLNTMFPRPQSKTSFASLLHKAAPSPKREVQFSPKSQHMENTFQILLDNINDAKNAIKEFRNSEDTILTMPSSIAVVDQDTISPGYQSSSSVTKNPSKAASNPIGDGQFSSKTTKLRNKVTNGPNVAVKRSPKSQTTPNKFQKLLDKYKPMLDKIDANSRLERESDDTIYNIPNSRSTTLTNQGAPSQDDFSDIYEDSGDIGIKKEMSCYESYVSLKDAHSEESTEPDGTVTREFLQALPEVTKLMKNATISPGIKSCINNALSKLIDTESKKIKQATHRRLESQQSGKYDQRFTDFYNYRDHISDTDQIHKSYGLYYPNPILDLPTWFLVIFKHGPVRLNLHGTFPENFSESIDDAKMPTEYEELAKANFDLTISFSGLLEKYCRSSECEIFVKEHLHFPRPQAAESSTLLQYSHLMADLFGCDVISVLRVQWRKEYNCIFSGSEPCRKNRVPFIGSHVERPSSYVLGSRTKLGWQKNFHLVFMLTGSGQGRHVCGTYRRQMSTCDKFMTWRFRIK